MSLPPRSQGFTLLELLIAIAIFALLGLATYRMLDSVLQTDQVTRQQQQQLRELVRAISTFERDVLQVRARTIRDLNAQELAALVGEEAQSSIELTRSGWRNPLGQPRADLQRVRWLLNGQQWQRLYWPVLDQAQDAQPQIQQALQGVVRVQVRYRDADGLWQNSWPPAHSGLSPELALRQLPQAVELLVEHQRFGEIRRLLLLPDTPPTALAEQAAENDADSAQALEVL